MAAEEHWLTVGKIATVFGVKGWLKIHSYTEPAENILNYRDWQLLGRVAGVEQRKRVVVDQIRRHGNGVVAHIEGVDERELAKQYSGWRIQVARDSLPALAEDDYYWHQLQGLSVYQVDVDGAPQTFLGRVDYLLETGANDVLVVVPDDAAPRVGGVRREILIPYLPQQVVLVVDLSAATIWVDWPLEE